MTPTPGVTVVYWGDPRACSRNAVDLINQLYPDCKTIVALRASTYESAQRANGPGPRVDAYFLANAAGYSVDAVLSDDPTKLVRS